MATRNRQRVTPQADPPAGPSTGAAGAGGLTSYTPRARLKVTNQSVWFVTARTFARGGPPATIRTSLPVCCCEPGTGVVAYDTVIGAASAMVRVVVTPVVVVPVSTVWLVWSWSAVTTTSVSA